MMQAKTHSEKTSHRQQSIMDQQWCQTCYWQDAQSLWLKKINNEETIAEYIEARRQVLRIVKQGKLNKGLLSIARICKHNPKSFYSYINERRIVRYIIGPLKTQDEIITTNNDMANTMNNYYTVPQLDQTDVISLTLSTLALRKYKRSCNFWTYTSPQNQICFTLNSPCIWGQTC